MRASIQAVPGESLSDAMPSDGWEERLLKESEAAAKSVGYKFHAEAVQNAPRSPSLGILRNIWKGYGQYTTKATKRRAAVLVKNTDYYAPATILAARVGKENTLRLNPGGLEHSIMMEYGDDHVDVFIASNAEAAGYAEKMHDEKGSTWKERGPGTQAKGPQADDKFIKRAFDNWHDEFLLRMKIAYEIAFRKWK